MAFNINRAFKLIPFVWGDYDGHRFRASAYSSLPFIWTLFWWIFTTYDFLRYTTLAILPAEQRVVLDFYLADYCSILTGNPYRLMILVGPLYNGECKPEKPASRLEAIRLESLKTYLLPIENLIFNSSNFQTLAFHFNSLAARQSLSVPPAHGKGRQISILA